MFNKLRTRLTFIFILLALIPVLLTGGLLSLRSFNALQDQSLNAQQQEARLAGTNILNFINERENQLRVISDVRHLSSTDRADQSATLGSLLRYDPSYQEFALLDAQGQELLLISRERSAAEDELGSRSDREEFLQPSATGEIYFSPVRFNELIQEPIITIALPLEDIRTGEISLILIAELRFRPVWDFIANIELEGEDDAVFVTNTAGELVAHANPSLVLSRTRFNLPENDGQAEGLSGNDVILARDTLQFGEQTLIVVAERPVADALAPATDGLRIAIILLAVTALVAVVIIAVIVRQIVIPVEKLSATAQKIAGGDLTATAQVTSRDEIGELAQSFNSMTHQLTDLIDNLEQRVQERTRDLQVAADVSTQVTTILDQNQLLTEVVNQLRNGFDFYSTAVYLFDEPTNTLTLTAGVGRDGVALQPGSIRYPLDTHSIMAKTANERQALVFNNVRSEASYQLNPALPNTHSEFSVPMVVGDELIGVLDFQSEQPNRFKESDLQVLPLVARQVGIAIRNVRSFEVESQARQAAEEANLVKSQFLANMSHELRTPLNAILNFTGFVAKGVMGPVNEKQVETLNGAIESGKHLLSLINDILDITKIEAGMMDLFIQEFSMSEILNATESIAKGLVKDKPIQLLTEIEDQLPQTYGDKRRLRQVMLNLLSNAVKFTSEGSVKITARYRDQLIKISVEDTGIGIAPEDHGMVFDSFKQVKHDLPEVLGTGLGLPITKYFVEAHGGRIWLESEVGAGTRFFVELPILNATEASAINAQIAEKKLA